MERNPEYCNSSLVHGLVHVLALLDSLLWVFSLCIIKYVGTGQSKHTVRFWIKLIHVYRYTHAHMHIYLTYNSYSPSTLCEKPQVVSNLQYVLHFRPHSCQVSTFSCSVVVDVVVFLSVSVSRCVMLPCPFQLWDETISVSFLYGRLALLKIGLQKCVVTVTVMWGSKTIDCGET